MELLQLQNLQKDILEHDGSTVTISRIVDLSLQAGQQLLLTGPSGSGKTTLLHMIAGLLQPSAGTIIFDGVRVDTMQGASRDLWRGQNIGYVLQRLNLLEALTVEENIYLAGYLIGRPMCDLHKATAKLLERVGLPHKAQAYPRQLSVGEQQRVAVARAVLNRPRLLLADEPTASLDTANAELVLELLRELCSCHATALLLSTHDPRVMQRFECRFDLPGGGRYC